MMSKYDLDVDLPLFEMSRRNAKQQSDVVYRGPSKLINTKYTSAGDKEFILEMHGKNKQQMHPKNYKAEHEKTKKNYKFVPDSVDTVHAKEVAKMQSRAEYLKGYKEAVKTASAYKNIDIWPEDKFHAEVTRYLSKHIYQEDYLVDRECCFYPVHITPGYELALEVNKFQSQWLYKNKYNKEMQG